MSPDRETIATYDERSGEYASLVPSARETRALSEFIDALPHGAYVMDLGCGPGFATARMVAAGLRVDALDASARMAHLARENSHANVVQGTFADLSAQNIYDGVWASFSLLHASRSDFPKHLRAIFRALTPGGIFFLGMKLGAGEKRDALGRLYTYYSEEELSGHLADAGFTPTGSQRWQGRGLSGLEEPCISVTAHA